MNARASRARGNNISSEMAAQIVCAGPYVYFDQSLLYVCAMAKPICPYCGTGMRFAPRLFGMPYCDHCGWRLEDAEKASRQMALVMPVIALLGIALVYRTTVLGWPLGISFIYLAGAVVFPVTVGLLSWLDYRKIIIAEPQAISSKPENWLVLATLEYQRFLRLSVPRTLSISWKGRLRIFIGVVCLGIIAYLLVLASLANPGTDLVQRLYGAALPVSVLLLLGGWANLNLIRQFRSQRPVIISGKAVIGRITQQQFQKVRIGMDMLGRYSLVQYEFHDGQGLPVSGVGHDYSKSLFQEMPALIFYDEADPSSNVALGCSLYEVKCQ